MTVREMHIEIEQSTQQVAANRARKWLPDEIDWVLNKMQDRFITSCLRPRQDGSGGFELDQVKGDQIRQLITRASLAPYIDGTERYKCFLPANYVHLLSDWSYTFDLCGGTLPTPASRTLFVSSVQQVRSDEESPPYYAEVSIALDGLTIAIPGDLPFNHTYTGYQEKEDITFLIPWILWKGKTIYWEKFDELYLPGTYIIVKTSSPTDDITVQADDEEASGDTETRVLTYNTGTGSKYANRLTATEAIASLNQSVNWRTAHFSPISELEAGNLIIHRDNSFTVIGVDISYIRKPQPISLSLATDCELAGEATHQAICDLATEYIKGTVQNAEGTALKKTDIGERVTL